ncbi:MAG TPA: ABC transporter substrate-binding protein [Candidatus Baltobacteraceae bacterium]|nr:ABC transporter substrate-binding protein [Candidatus Baltobacteraceae bacterium]
MIPLSATPHVAVIADGFGDPSSLNPYIDGAWPTGAVTGELALAYFVHEAPNGALAPYLLTRIPNFKNGDVSDDGRRITFHLRPHLRWSDGVPLSADDVAFTVRAIKDPKNNAVVAGFDLITRVVVKNKTTVVFYLKRPYADFSTTYFSTDGRVCLLPRHAFKGLDIEHSPFNSKPIGAGPFRVVAWHRGSDIEFERNPYYFGPPAKLKRVIYRIQSSISTTQLQFQTGEVHFWDRVPETRIALARAVRGAHVLETSPDAYLHIDFNVNRVRDRSIREAVRFALDRREIAKAVTGGLTTAQEGVVNDANPLAWKLPLIEQDTMRAKALLRARLPTLHLIYPLGDETISTVVELVREQLENAGISLEAKGYTNVQLTVSILPNGAWDMALFNWSLDPTADLSDLYKCSSAAPNGSNYGRYCNPEMDRLLKRFASTYDVQERMDILRREEALIDHDVPTIVLFMRDWGFAESAAVTGFAPRRDSPFDGFESADVK